MSQSFDFKALADEFGDYGAFCGWCGEGRHLTQDEPPGLTCPNCGADHSQYHPLGYYADVQESECRVSS